MTNAVSHGARGAAITVVGQVLMMAIQFASVIVLSRLLSPDDFGILAMITVFMGIGALIRDFGLPTAALQAQKLTEQQAANIFWVTAVLSVGTGTVIAALTPLIVHLYDEPRLTLVTPVMASVLVLTGLQAQYHVRLARQMRFKLLVLLDLSSRIVGLAIAIGGALAGWTYWALVAGQVVPAVLLLASSVVASRWVPMRPRRGSDSMGVLRAGGNFGVANLLGYAADNADNMMIGAIWGAGPLGHYNRAFQLFMNPIQSIFGPLTKVVVPTINRAVEEGRSASDLLLKVQSSVCGAAIWILLATSVTADWLVPLLLGDQWKAAIPLLQILSLGGAFKVLSQTNYWAYIVHQQSRELLQSNLITKPIQIVLIVVAAFHGVEWVACAFTIGRAITWPINLFWLSRTADQDPWRFGWNGLRLVAAATVSYGVTYFVLHQWPPDGMLWLLLVGGAMSTAVYIAVIAATPGGIKELGGAVELVRMLRGRGTKR